MWIYTCVHSSGMYIESHVHPQGETWHIDMRPKVWLSLAPLQLIPRCFEWGLLHLSDSVGALSKGKSSNRCFWQLWFSFFTWGKISVLSQSVPVDHPQMRTSLFAMPPGRCPEPRQNHCFGLETHTQSFVLVGWRIVYCKQFLYKDQVDKINKYKEPG